MIQFETPVRRGVAVRLDYAYEDQDGAAIDLTAYSTVHLEVKRKRGAAAAISAAFVSPRTAGTVRLASHAFAESGTWQAQFYADDSGGNRLWGEPVEFEVVDNVDDAGLSQLLEV